MRISTRCVVIALAVGCLALRSAYAQATADSARVAITADSSWRGWLSLALGPGSANGQPRLGGDLALWFTHDRLAFALRTATASRFLEAGEVGDVAVLAGFHARTERHTDAVIGAGLGMLGGTGSGGERLSSVPAIAVGAQANINYVFAGIGIDAFGAIGNGQRLWGIGVALALGVFR